MDAPYDWPLEWDLRTPPGDACFAPLQHSHPDSWQLLISLGGHFLKRLIAALLAPNGHFPSLLLSTLWGIQGGFTSLCVQGIFGSGKTYCASLLLVLVSTVLRLPTVLTAEPNLPLATAAETISDLLRDAPDETKSAYARVLAYSVPKLTPIDVLPIDRPKLFQSDSPILTHGSVLRDLCRDYPQIRTFLEACRLAINDESQQGGHAGFTILATCLLRECLQIFTGDREQTRAGTGGDQLRESLLKRLSHKSIGFLGGPLPRLPSEMVASFASALADETTFSHIGASGHDPFPLLAALTSQVLPSSCHPTTVFAAEGLIPTAGVLLHLILPHSLRCPADAYLTQVAMHYPHLHRSSGHGVAYGHYEEPPLQIRKSRLPVDMQGHEYKLSGYRLVHWDPTLKPPKGQNHMDLATRHTALTVAAVLSYYTARSIRLDNESSKLLLLTPHNDSVVDLQDALGLPAPNYPPTLYDFYLTILYKQHFLPSNLAKFPRRDHNDTRDIIPDLHAVTPMEIYHHIQAHADELVPQLEAFATLRAIVEIVHTCPKGFASYCTISNTVKAIGIGGSASLFASVKMSSFLASTQEAEARNLVALTRSKGLCLLLLPSTHEHTESPLHTIRTMCALRHGLFHIGKDSVDLDAFAAFLSQPDTVDFAHDGITIDGSAPFSLDSWLFTHQISYFGKWDFLPLALRLTFRTIPFILKLSLRQEVPRANTFLATPDLFYWQGHLLDGIRVTLNFGVNCLELASEHFIYARFNYPAPGLTPPLLEDNGWTVVPESGSYFFSRASLSLGHLHPSQSRVIDPSDPLRPPNLLKWPATSPVTRSHVAHLPMHGNPTAPPSFLPASAIHFFHMGLTRLCEQEVLQDPQLNHAAWLAAFAAHTGTDLTTEHLALLQHPSIPGQFPSKVFAPLQAGHQEPVKEYVSEIISCTGPSWAVKKNRPRSTGSQTPPDDAAIQELPRTTRDPLPAWVDQLNFKTAHLAALLSEAQDLPKSPKGWIKCSALCAYNGPSIPGNFDTHTGEIINTNTFTLSSQGLTQALTDEFICGMVSKDNIRGRNRFQLCRFAPGKTSTSSQLVIRLTPLPHGASAVPSTTSSRDIPLTLEQAEPYAIYFFQSSMLRVLTREGIRPKRKSPYGSSSLLKVQPTDTWGPVGTSQLRGRSDACLLIDMHASLESGTQWIQHASDGCYGTDQVPLTPQFLLAAFRFSASGTGPFWSAPTSAQPAQPARASRAPATFFTHTDTVEAAQIDTRADMRLDAHLSAPPVIPIPEEDDDLHEAPPDIEMPLSTAVEDAFAHLERAIDNMHAEHPTHPGFDPLFYLALSNLPLTYPWPILTVDLKNFLPLMDRHVMTHLVAGRSAVNPQYQHPAPVLASFFTDLAHTIAHHLLAPLRVNSQYMRPNLPPRIFTSEFWHAHFNYAALRTDPSLAAVGSMDGLAGDLPPPLGAFVLANHQSHEDFKSTPASATQATPIFSVQQHLQFPLPQVFTNQQEQLSLARQSAVEGYLSPETIPFLGHSNQHLTYKKVRWALRFPFPPPTKDPSARRFSSTPAFRQGPRSNEALEGAIRVAAPFSYNSEASVYLTDSHFLKLPDCDPYLGSLHRNVNPAPPDAATCAWLRSGALRLSQRDEGDKSSIPLGLLAFFGSDISHKHVTELIRSHSTTNQDTISRMRAEHRVGRVVSKPSWNKLLRPKEQKLHLLLRLLTLHPSRKALPSKLLSLVHRPLNQPPHEPKPLKDQPLKARLHPPGRLLLLQQILNLLLLPFGILGPPSPCSAAILIVRPLAHTHTRTGAPRLLRLARIREKARVLLL